MGTPPVNSRMGRHGRQVGESDVGPSGPENPRSD